MKRNIEKRNLWHMSGSARRRAVAWMSAILMLFTMLPVNAMGLAEEVREAETYCGLERHQHTASCYEDGELSCGLPAHEHMPECYIERDEAETEPMKVKAVPVEPAKQPVEVELVSEKEAAGASRGEPSEASDGEALSLSAADAALEVDADAAEQPEAAVTVEEAVPEASEATLDDASEVAEAVEDEGVEAAEDEGVEAEKNESEAFEIEEETVTEEPEAEETAEEEPAEAADIEEAAEAEETAEADAIVEVEEAAEEPEAEEAAEAEEMVEAEAPAEAEETAEAEEAIEEEKAVEAEEAVVAYPAQSFEARAFNVAVTARAPEGAFPEGTTMQVSRVWDSDTLSDIRETVTEDFVEVKRVTAVDITFRDAEGAEIEPLVPIEVAIAVAEIREEQSAVVVHVDDAGNAEVVDQADITDAADTMELTVEMPAAELSFEADAFSIYAVVVTETIETRYIAADGETYNIKVTYGPEANIPAGAALEVRELAAGDYIDQVEAALPEGERAGLARFFDIAIVADGAEIEPAAPVWVNIALDETDEGDVRAVHFEDGGDVTLIDVEPADEGVAFSADSFSVYGLVFTIRVDVDGETYAVSGHKSIMLSDILDAVGVEEYSAAEVSAVSVSDAQYMSAEQDGDDWQLTVAKPFSEVQVLTLTVDGAEKTIELKSAIREWEITELLNKLEVYDENDNLIGNEESGEPFKLSPDKSYKVNFHLREQSKLQFSDSAAIPMYLQLPEGIVLTGFGGQKLPLDLELDDGITLRNNEVTYDEVNNRLYIKWNNADAEAFELLTDSAVAEFWLKMTAKFTGDSGEIKFNKDISIEVEPDDSYTAHVEKKGTYDNTTGKVNYTVAVWADGAAEEVVVKDTITGDALSYDADSLAVELYPEEGEGEAVAAAYTAINPDGNGFKLTLDTLPNDKKAVITYTASVDFDKLTGKGTAVQTGNKVTVSDSGDGAEQTFDLENRIDYVSLEKASLKDGAFEWRDGKVVVPWTIVYNFNPKASVAGATLTDSIASGAVDAMQYDLDTPFIVKRYPKEAGRGSEEFETIVDSWNDVEVSDYNNAYSEGQVTVSGQSWKWTVPQEDGGDDEDPCWYEITYNTLVDPAMLMMPDATITNTVTEDKTGNHAEGGYHHDGSGVPSTTSLAVKKEAVQVTSKWTKWKVSFPRWSFDLVPAYLIDTHPTASGSGGNVYEKLVTTKAEAEALEIPAEAQDNLISVQGLKTLPYTDAEGEEHNAMEHVDVAYSDNLKTIFHFELVDVDTKQTDERGRTTYDAIQIAGKEGTGLLALYDGDDEDKYGTITLTFYTANSATWINGAMDGNYPVEHKNDVELIANGQSVKDDATVTPDATGFSKRADNVENGIIKPVATLKKDGKLLPVYQFTLTLKGIGDRENDPVYTDNNWFGDGDSFDITDTHSDYLRLLTDEDFAALGWSGGYRLVPVVPESTSDGDKVTVDASETGATTTFTVRKDSFPTDDKSNAIFARKYELTYYLTLDTTRAETMAMVKELLEHPSEDGEVLKGVANTARANGMEASIDPELSVNLKPISKSVSQIGSSEKYTYKIIVNPLGVQLNGGHAYRLTDTFENLAVDFSTMKIDPSTDVKWTYHGNEGTFWIPDGTPTIITYEAWPVFERGKNFQMKNTAEIDNYSDSVVSEEMHLELSGGGSAHVYRLQLLKYEDDDMSVRLAKVKFQLFELNSMGELVPMKYVPVEILDDDGNPTGEYYRQAENIIFETDSKGMSKLRLSKMKDGVALESGKQYYLKELETEDNKDYNIQDIYWSFIISDVSDYTAYVYRSNDVLKISNSSKKAALILRKEFDTADGGVDLPYSLTKDIEFEVVGKDAADKVVFDRTVKYSDFTKYYPETGTEGYYCYRLPWDDVDIATAVHFTITELNADFNSFTRLTKINGTVHSEDKPTTGSFDRQSEDYTVTFTNKYTPKDMSLEISKAWQGGSASEGDYVAFKLYRNDEVYETVTLNADNDWSAVLPGLSRYDAEGNAYAWSVEEVAARFAAKFGETEITNAEDVAEHFTITATANGGEEQASRDGTRWQIGLPTDEKGAVTGDGKTAAISFVNAPNDMITVEVKKVWNGSDGGYSEVVFDLYRTTEELGTLEADALLDLEGVELVRAGVTLEKGADGVWPAYTNDMMEKYNNTGAPYHYFAIERSVAGYIVDYDIQTTREGSVQTQTLTLTNTPDDRTGSLSVTKNLSGRQARADETFSFTVTNSGKWLNADGSLTTTPTTITIAAGETKQFSGLPIGTYTVEEAPSEAEGYDLTVSMVVEVKAQNEESETETVSTAVDGSSAEAEVKAGDTTVTITNTYSKGKTDFTFGKLWNNRNASTVVWPQNTSIDVAIGRYSRNVGKGEDDLRLVYTISRGTGSELTAVFNRAESTFASGVSTAPTLEILGAGKWHQYKFKLSDLPEKDDNDDPWTYYAEEIDPKLGFKIAYGVVDGFSASVNDEWEDAHTTTSQVLNQPIIGNIINKLETFRISVPVRKQINGYGRTPREDEEYSFTLSYDPYYPDEGGMKTVITTGSEVAWFEDLAIVPDSVTTDKVNGVSCILFSFTYTIREDGPTEDNPYRLGMQYYDKEITVTDVVAVEWETRRIVEETRTIASASESTKGKAEIKDLTGAPQAVQITNNYVEETWKLRLRKNWDDAGNQDKLRGDLKFTIKFTDANGKTYTRSYELKNNTATWQQAAFDVVYDVPKFIDSVAIVKYEISENELTGYEVSWLDEGNTIENAEGYNADATVINDELLDEAPVEVTNSHEPYTVDVRIHKDWVGDSANKRPQKLTMTLYVQYEGQAEAKFDDVKASWGSAYSAISGTAELNARNGWAYTWEDLPKNAPGLVGKRVTYSVKEENTAELPLGYYQSNPGAPSESNGVITQEITNTYSLVKVAAGKVWEDDGNRDGLRDSVTLVLSATVDGASVKAAIANAGYNVDDKTIDVGDPLTVEWNDLPERLTNGKKIAYAVTEQDLEGYDSAVTRNNVTEDGYCYNFTATNTHTYEKTQIDFTKTWAGDGDNLRWRTSLADYLDKLELRMNGVLLTKGVLKDGKQYLTTTETVSASDRAAIEAAWVALDEDGDTYTVCWYNLPRKAGGTKISYTLKEKPIEGYASNPASGDVALSEGSDGNYTGALTNTRKTVDLRISKALVSDLKADGDEVFSFTVNTVPEINGAYSDVAFTNGESEPITLKGGEEMTLEGLPTLVTYTVTETPDARNRFIVKANGAAANTTELPAADSDAGRTLSAAFTNTRRIGDLTISKIVETPLDFDEDHEFQFRVTLADETISGTYGDVTFDGGVATVGLRHGESKKAEGLPTDLDYTVEEITDGSDAAYLAYFASDRPAEGTITTAGNTAAFTNTRAYAPVRLMKVDSTNDGKLLAEAEFTLSWNGGSLELVSDKTGALIPQSDVDDGTVVAVKDSALMKLANGEYTLNETKAPGGYRKLAGNIKLAVENFAVTVQIDEDQNEDVQVAAPNALTDEQSVVEVLLPNHPGAEYPTTGGAGNLPYYVGGIGLLLLALFMTLRRRTTI